MPFLNQRKGENDRRKYFMINLHERMLPTSAGVEPATSWSPVGRRIQLSHRGRYTFAIHDTYTGRCSFSNLRDTSVQELTHFRLNAGTPISPDTILCVQSTLVISNSKGLSEILRNIRTSTYQICRTEEKIIRTTAFNKYMCNWTHKIWRYIENIVKLLLRSNLLFSTILFYMLLDFHV